MHAHSGFDVELSRDGGALTVSVIDDSRSLPHKRAIGPSAGNGGRGLAIVDALAARWGSDLIPGAGKRTRFQLDAPARDGDDPPVGLHVDADRPEVELQGT